MTGPPQSSLRVFVEEARANTELETARPALAILTAVLAGGTIIDAISSGLMHAGTIATINLVTLGGSCVATIATIRPSFPAHRTRAVATVAVILTLANILATIVWAGRSTDCAAYAMVLLGLSAIVLSPAIVASVGASASLAWGLLGAPMMLRSDVPAWLLTMVGSSALALALSVSRARSTGRLAILRFRDLRRRERFERAAATARAQLVLRMRLESERSELRAQLGQAQKLEAIGTLAGGVAHDMNNVLAAITSLTEGVLGEQPIGSGARADLESVLEAAQRGAELTRNLLAFGRKGKYRSERVSMRRITASVRALVERTLPKHVQLTFDSDEHDDVVQGDSSQLQNAILNLCINAAHAMPQGGAIQVRSASRTLDGADAERFGVRPGHFVVVDVRDDGCGMDEETKRRAFEPFFTTKATGRGTGLGLAMVYGTAVGHGGGVALESDVGVGTRISLAVPRVPAKPDVRLSTPMPAPALTGTRVLLVDDEPLVRRGARRLLERLGCTVEEAEDGLRGLEAYVEHGPFDVVVLDMAMPELGGAECFRRLRAHDPAARVILASGYASDRETDALLASGACCFLEKPYAPSGLASALMRSLDRRSGPGVEPLEPTERSA